MRNDVYLTSSTDRGRSFGANVRLTSDSSDSRIGQTYAVASSAGLHEFGSRLGLLSTRSTAVAAWADTRNSPSASIAQDVFAAVVSVAATGQRGQPAILLLPARWGEHALSWLVGAGLGVAVWTARRCVRRRARRRGDQRRERSSAAASALTRPTRRRQAYPVALLALAAVTVTSCAARVPALAPPVVVRVTMSDDDHGGSAYHVERHVRAGRLVFGVRNDGRNRHELIVLKLPAEPALPLDALVASSSKRAFPTLIAAAAHPARCDRHLRHRRHTGPLRDALVRHGAQRAAGLSERHARGARRRLTAPGAQPAARCTCDLDERSSAFFAPVDCRRQGHLVRRCSRHTQSEEVSALDMALLLFPWA